jgi:hypothetical protein
MGFAMLDRSYEGSGMMDGLETRLADRPAPATLSSADIVSFIAMDGLTNMWLGQAGRRGKYVTVVLAETIPGRKAA